MPAICNQSLLVLTTQLVSRSTLALLQVAAPLTFPLTSVLVSSKSLPSPASLTAQPLPLPRQATAPRPLASLLLLPLPSPLALTSLLSLVPPLLPRPAAGVAHPVVAQVAVLAVTALTALSLPESVRGAMASTS